jgi:hypothetical protein
MLASWRWSPVTLSIFLVVALGIYDAFWLMVGIDQPLFDQDTFRETQTAISAYWLAKGGPFFAYETPVLGAPWSIPFEFPLYQGVVAGVVRAGLSVEIAGRLISFCFFLGCLWPMRLLCRQYRLPETVFLFASALFLASPIYTLYGRAVMIETTALFFAMAWLAFFARMLERPRLASVSLTLVFGVAAVLSKSTTFPAFALCGVCLFLASIWPDLQNRKLRSVASRGLLAAIVTLVPLTAGVAWIQFTDIVKLRSTGGSLLTSSSLSLWNFGAWSDRFASKLWRYTIEKRVVKDIFGSLSFLAGFVILFALLQRRYALAVLLCLLGFLAPFLLFTNLHTTHVYYQASNAIFAIGACAIGIQAVFDRSRRLASVLLLALILSQAVFFKSKYQSEVLSDFSQNDVYRIARMAQDLTPNNSVLVVFGQDWSSAVPYQAGRRGVVMSGWFPRSMFEVLSQRPDGLLGGLPLGAIVDCGTDGYENVIDLIKPYVAGRMVLGEAGHCRLLSPAKS